MKPRYLWQFGLLAAIGCTGSQAPVAQPGPAAQPSEEVATTEVSKTTELGDGMTFVSLNVPNMH